MTRAGGNIPDYTDSGSPETWNVSNAYEFGFSARGGNVNTTTWGNDSTSDCVAGGASIPSAELLWRGFTGTTPILIATTTSPTTPEGTNTSLCVAVEQDTQFIPSGAYTATLTATATAK